MTQPVIGEDGLARCPWAAGDPVNMAYHDEEWGMPVEGEAAHLERLTLEAFQSGLSWLTILNKRPAFREVFAGFDADTVASYDVHDIERLMAETRIVRNRRKIEAAVANARATVALRERGGLVDLLWSFRPAESPAPRGTSEQVASTVESTALSKALKEAGFAHVGPTTMHALMQAVGIIDDHLVGCHRRGCASLPR
ncbi:DNA-3-methyladenine glycosylase I [Nocardioides seonyuensis]|nr:DNA-3-methyladenine glycosylase I [Nocardioides seonyuensis]